MASEKIDTYLVCGAFEVPGAANRGSPLTKSPQAATVPGWAPHLESNTALSTSAASRGCEFAHRASNFIGYRFSTQTLSAIASESRARNCKISVLRWYLCVSSTLDDLCPFRGGHAPADSTPSGGHLATNPIPSWRRLAAPSFGVVATTRFNQNLVVFLVFLP